MKPQRFRTGTSGFDHEVRQEKQLLQYRLFSLMARIPRLAALGNQVRQLHMHVIARFTEDAAWPNPVWGSGPAVAYEKDAAERFIADFKAGFEDRT